MVDWETWMNLQKFAATFAEGKVTKFNASDESRQGRDPDPPRAREIQIFCVSPLRFNHCGGMGGYCLKRS